jgi:hypothetical protein
MERMRLLLGSILSLAWVGTYLILTFKSGAPDMTPNAWGDWAAGLAAPVALGWLVLGYLQQGDELRESTKALNDQARALRRSVRQQQRQALLTEKAQALALRTQIVSHQPCFVRFTVKNTNQGKNAFSIYIENVGRTCFNARFAFVSPTGRGRFKMPPGVRNWTTGNANEIRIADVPSLPDKLVFTITYLDEVMAPQEQRFQLLLKQFPLNETVLAVSRIGMTFNPPEVEVPQLPVNDDDTDQELDEA